jgi:2',3'-cyclic-nucleotide 2'-phosphodiesterase (5'-nucleotidase family)
VRTRPTNLGRLVSNSLTPPADKYLADIVGTEDRVDVSIMNSGGIRASIEGPSITQLDIDKALPFNHEVVVVKVTANQFLAAMENSVCVYPSTASEMVSGRYLQMVGAEMEFDASKSGVCNATELDEGSRVRYLKVFGKGVIVENGALVNEEQEFVLATNSYLASGGDEYSSLAAAAFLGNTGLGQQHVLWDDIMGRLGGHVDIKDPPESLSVTCIGGDCL